MRKPRLLPIAITAIFAAALLFGGSMLYKQYSLASPLAGAVESVPGVARASAPSITRDEVRLSLELAPDASLREVFREVSDSGKAIAGDRQLIVDVASDSSDELEKLWQGALFEVAEAMETRNYSSIPEAMERAVHGHGHVAVTTEMDETNVYITMKSGDATKHVVLPRTPVQLGVWSHA